MLMSVFAIYDAGISTWMPPLFARNKGEIMRWFMDVSNDPQSKISKYPSDYTIFEIGTWDDDKCKFTLLSTPISIGIAIEYVKASKDVVDNSNAALDQHVPELRQLGSGGR